MIKIKHRKTIDAIFINPQHIVEVRTSIVKEPREDGGINMYVLYRVFLVNTASEISDKEFDLKPLKDWLDTATSHFSTNGKMLY